MFKPFAYSLLFFLSWLTACSQSLGGYTSGATAFCDSINSGFISLNNYSGTVLKWESRINSAVSWTSLMNPTSSQSYNNLKKTTTFRAIVKNGSFPADTSAPCTITVQVKGETGSLTGGGIFCGETGSGVIKLNDFVGNVNYWQSSGDSGLTWVILTGTSPSYTFTNITQTSLYRAIVSALPVCPKDTTKNISFTIHQKTKAGTISGGDSLCYGSPGDTLKIKNSVGTVLDWFSSGDNGISWKSLGIKDTLMVYPGVVNTTVYRATLKSATCNSEDTPPVTVAAYSVNVANAGPDKEIIQFQYVVLEGSGKGTPHWTPSSSLNNENILMPVADPEDTKIYVLTLSDAHGCLTSDSVTVKVIIPVPTVITPNDDMVNDYFMVDKIEEYSQNTLTVYNRWGSEVYSARQYKNTWNGKSNNGNDLPDDIYYYILDYGNGEKPFTNYILIKR
ncbi:hypothetical protein CNR22_23095 [Sphingobacteriaceae bacterium]|nr:hypothetical protein CNR22_23095 [Sphingobacteriaceae bacterium]